MIVLCRLGVSWFCLLFVACVTRIILPSNMNCKKASGLAIMGACPRVLALVESHSCGGRVPLFTTRSRVRDTANLMNVMLVLVEPGFTWVSVKDQGVGYTQARLCMKWCLSLVGT